MIAQPLPTAVAIPTTKRQRQTQLREEIIAKYRKTNTNFQEILHWIEQDRKMLKLDAQKTTPDWTPEARADMNKRLLAYRAKVDEVYEEDRKRNKWWRRIGRGIAWGPTILWNLIISILFNLWRR